MPISSLSTSILYICPTSIPIREECQPKLWRNRRSSIFTKLFVFLFCPFTFVHSPPSPPPPPPSFDSFRALYSLLFLWPFAHLFCHPLWSFDEIVSHFIWWCAPVKLTPFRLMRSHTYIAFCSVRMNSCYSKKKGRQRWEQRAHSSKYGRSKGNITFFRFLLKILFFVIRHSYSL